jgi:hypothetical protein
VTVPGKWYIIPQLLRKQDSLYSDVHVHIFIHSKHHFLLFPKTGSILHNTSVVLCRVSLLSFSHVSTKSHIGISQLLWSLISDLLPSPPQSILFFFLYYACFTSLPLEDQALDRLFIPSHNSSSLQTQCMFLCLSSSWKSQQNWALLTSSCFLKSFFVFHNISVF